MPLIETLRDDFTGSTSLSQYTGNGTITFPGTVARLVCPNGNNCNWDYTATGAPLVYDGVAQQLQKASMPFFAETRLAVFSGTTNYRLAGLVWFTTPYLGLAIPGAVPVPFYGYYFTYYKYEGKIIVDYQYPTGATRLATSATVVDPASTPHRYRIYWNPTDRPLWINEISLVLQNDRLCFAYSLDEGATWVSLLTRTRDFAARHIGVLCRKWETSAVSAQADFDYFSIQEYDENDLVLSPHAGVGDQVRLAMEDRGGVVTESGPPRFDLPEAGGPLSLYEQVGVALEDQGGLLGDGQNSRFDAPWITEAVTGRESVAIEDAFQCHLNDSDYIKGLNDSEGREFIGYTAIRQVVLYDATQDPWHTHGPGHYGAGRDGKLYYDGVECGPGSFGTLADGRRKTSWASNDDFVDVVTAGAGAGLYATSPTISADDELQLALVASANGSGVSSRLRWFLTGDFDIQVDYEIVATGAGPTDGGISLTVAMDRNNFTYCRRRMWGNFYDKNVYNNGVAGTYVQVPTTDTSGKLRITRSGSAVASFYWTGSSWAQIGATVSMTHTKPMYVDCNLIPLGGSVTATARLRNFTINSGSTTNRIGWAREAAGAYRGSQAEFPQHALISASGNGFDIIDVDTQKLWMSFRGAANNLVGGDGNYYIRQIAIKDGVLLVAYRTRDTYATADGFAAWIDFTLDFVRMHRGTTYADAGLIYNVELTTGVWPRDSANGCIAFRNSARGTHASYQVNWRFQNSRANWCDILNDGDFQYRAVANNGGAYVAMWRRWRFEGTAEAHLNTPAPCLSEKTTAMQWIEFEPSSKALFYHDRDKVYITNWSTLYSVLSGGGGTFVVDHEYTLAGTASQYVLVKEAQDKMLFYGGYLWYARVEGIYRMDIGTGVSTLFYGQVGSGATHTPLPGYSTIVSLHQAVDGFTPILLVGLTYPDRVVAVNMNTHALYWRGRTLDSRTPVALAIGA